MNKNKLLGLMSLVGSAFIGGAILPSVIRFGTSLMHPFLLNWLRVFVVLIMLLIFFRGKYKLKKLFQKKYFLSSLMLGLGLGLNVIMFAFGVQHTTLVASQLIYIATPIVTTLIAYLLLREKINSKKILGLFLAFCGVLLLIIFSQSASEKSSLGTFYGNFLIFIGMFGYSLYLIFSKKLNSNFSVVEVSLITNIFLSVLLAPMAIYAVFTQYSLVINTSFVLVIIGLGLAALLFMILVQITLKNLSAGTSSFSSLLSPEFAAIAGIAIYNEKLSLILILSMILSIGGTILSVQSDKISFIDKIKSKIEKLKEMKRHK